MKDHRSSGLHSLPSSLPTPPGGQEVLPQLCPCWKEGSRHPLGWCAGASPQTSTSLPFRGASLTLAH